jgi:class I fructose-bisphosphate aldolase
MSDYGKQIRLNRVFNAKAKKAVIVAYDHGLMLGPSKAVLNPGSMIQQLTEGGADAFLISPGLLKQCLHDFLVSNPPGIVLRLDWSNMWRSKDLLGFEEGRTRLLAQVEDAMKLGADAVLSYLFIGSEDPDVEAWEIEKNSLIARECEQLGMPQFIEPMARGLQVGTDIYKADYIKVHTRLASELGADLIKTDYSGDYKSFKGVVEGCLVPILIAGGPKTNTPLECLKMVEDAMRAGARGVVFGRNIIEAENPKKMIAAIQQIVHDDVTAEEAVKGL